MKMFMMIAASLLCAQVANARSFSCSGTTNNGQSVTASGSYSANSLRMTSRLDIDGSDSSDFSYNSLGGDGTHRYFGPEDVTISETDGNYFKLQANYRGATVFIRQLNGTPSNSDMSIDLPPTGAHPDHYQHDFRHATCQFWD